MPHHDSQAVHRPVSRHPCTRTPKKSNLASCRQPEKNLRSNTHQPTPQQNNHIYLDRRFPSWTASPLVFPHRFFYQTTTPRLLARLLGPVFDGPHLFYSTPNLGLKRRLDLEFHQTKPQSWLLTRASRTFPRVSSIPFQPIARKRIVPTSAPIKSLFLKSTYPLPIAQRTPPYPSPKPKAALSFLPLRPHEETPSTRSSAKQTKDRWLTYTPHYRTD